MYAYYGGEGWLSVLIVFWPFWRWVVFYCVWWLVTMVWMSLCWLRGSCCVDQSLWLTIKILFVWGSSFVAILAQCIGFKVLL